MSIRHKIAAFLLLALGLQTFALSSVRAEGWVTECVDCPRSFADMTDRSLALDGDGRPHVAYGGDNLYYAWHDGIAWHYETADPTPGVGRDASLALGKQGNPHIAYLDAANKAVSACFAGAAKRGPGHKKRRGDFRKTSLLFGNSLSFFPARSARRRTELVANRSIHSDKTCPACIFSRSEKARPPVRFSPLIIIASPKPSSSHFRNRGSASRCGESPAGPRPYGDGRT